MLFSNTDSLSHCTGGGVCLPTLEIFNLTTGHNHFYSDILVGGHHSNHPCVRSADPSLNRALAHHLDSRSINGITTYLSAVLPSLDLFGKWLVVMRDLRDKVQVGVE